ncbi:MAG: hypothetical protein KF910_12385 [Brevundimonas sp.]|uniref:hypothetical protein n=1 Tax=Brevundimonas sp. TaxID=1871086 RepID=UPI0025C52AB9|nr:hypothetical protein [Brevundimonas sp.]MBX3478403.1 hypothetical protein [Brevundimonas sp.]
MAFASLFLVAPPPAGAQSRPGEWFPAFETDAMFGALDRSSVGKEESHAFPTDADVRGIDVLFVPKAGAIFDGAQYGYVVAHAVVACDRNEITWVSEAYFHFGQATVQAVLYPPAAERKTIVPDTVDYLAGYGACTENAMTGTPVPSADQLAIQAKAGLMASISPPAGTGWMVVQTNSQQAMALDLGSIQPAAGQYAGNDLLQARTVTLSRGGTMRDGVRYDYVTQTHLIRCRAGATAVAYTNLHHFGSPADNPRRTIGPRLAPAEPGSAGMEAFIVACNLVPATTETFELDDLLRVLRSRVGL